MRPNHHRVMSTPPPPPGSSSQRRRRVYSDEEEDSPTPICRCRVLYLGSSVPCVTKDGLQGIQEPLKELYPDDEENQTTKGIDSWLSVWSNGFLLENIDENRKKVTRFFPIESLHYCAAVRYVLVPGSGDESKARFLPLDSPFAKNPYNNHPPLFAAILRRTSGIKVLECHVFICKKETAANALVRCSFHSYADSTYAKNLENGASLYGTLGNGPPLMSSPNHMSANGDPHREYQQSAIEVSEDSINSIEKVEEWKVISNGGNGGSNHHHPHHYHHHQQQQLQQQHHPRQSSSSPNPKKSPMNQNGKHGNPDEISVYNGDDNHKVWAGKTPPPGDNSGEIYDYGSTMRSYRSTASTGVSRKPRQMVMPSSPPPPPIREEESSSKDVVDGTTMKKDKKKKKQQNHRSKSRENTLKRPTDSQSVILNGGGRSTLNGHSRKISSTGSLVGMRHFHPPPPPPPPPPHHHHHHGGQGPRLLLFMTLRAPGKKAGTFSSRSKSRPPFVMYGGPPPPPHMMLPPHPHMMPPRHVLEEPIYMPHNARPLSPVASYQPGHFPHEAYYNQQQYATIDKAQKHRGKTRKAHQEDEASEFGLSGIHRKGQHINERAFSHSIRNEHRSRSYGSLANMSIQDHEKEMMRQMVSGMKLNGDNIERSEVPPGIYQRGGIGDYPPQPLLPHHPHHHQYPPHPPHELVGGPKGKNKKKR
ncbi:LOW QUALITY PROTEIN: uncharacterized protein [Lepeophtheirus salmonis]|uniref:LOW QUALITY PROTEIN: uncharacterized protein n=1 Tax=Lepeophtheirus salmonis TaxID=72036 RepID=UPI003AF3D376